MPVAGEALKRPFQKYEKILHRWHPEMIIGKTSGRRSSRYIASCRKLQLPVPTTFSRFESSSFVSPSSFKYSDPSWIAGAGGLAALSFLTGSMLVSYCEEETAASSNQQQQDEEEDDEPTYENLPEHDEETTCLLCKTHRHGPCRKQWRSFEYCVKGLKRDEGKTSSSSKACDCYIKPFEKCWMRNLNLYVLIANTINQELVEDIEHDFNAAHLRKAFASMPNIDWSKWISYLQTASATTNAGQEPLVSDNNSIVLKKLVKEYETKTTLSSSNKQLWEYFDEMQLEPNLVTVTSQIPIRIINQEDDVDASSSLILRVVYAVDQDNHAVGYSEYSGPSPSAKEHEKDDDMKQQEGETQTQQDHHVLALCLLPGITRAVRISAVYAEESRHVDDDETPTQVFLYTTSFSFLPSISARKAA